MIYLLDELFSLSKRAEFVGGTYSVSSIVFDDDDSSVFSDLFNQRPMMISMNYLLHSRWITLAEHSLRTAGLLHCNTRRIVRACYYTQCMFEI